MTTLETYDNSWNIHTDLPSYRYCKDYRRKALDDVILSLSNSIGSSIVPGLFDIIVSSLLDHLEDPTCVWDTESLSYKRAFSMLVRVYTLNQGNELYRRIRMKCLRAIYCINKNTFRPSQISLSRVAIPVPYSWDWLYLSDGEILVTYSQSEFSLARVAANKAPVPIDIAAGRSTQLDYVRLKNGSVSISVGSSYDNRILLIGNEGNIIKIEPAKAPVLLCDSYNTYSLIVYSDGMLTLGKYSIKLPTTRLDRVRRFNKYLFCFNWRSFNTMLCMDLDTMAIQFANINSVFIANDICYCNGNYFIVDKLGYGVTVLDSNLQEVTTLSLDSMLLDPIAIRNDPTHDNKMCILTWQDSTLSTFCLPHTITS